MKLFSEEKDLLADLLDEWYNAVKAFTNDMNRIFTEKGKQYDRESPVWERMKWPWGFTHEITKKANRVEQLLSAFDHSDPINSVDWDEINEELVDIANYCRMLGGVTMMMRVRKQ